MKTSYLILILVLGFNILDYCSAKIENGFVLVDNQKKFVSTKFKNINPKYNIQNWNLLPNDQNYKNNKIGVRCKMQYTPNNLNINNKPIVLFVIHGTGFFGLGGPSTNKYFDICDTDYQNILEFAGKYSQMRRSKLFLVSFGWSGYNNTKDRRDAAKELASIINNQYKDYEINTLSHSHGGNVVNMASHKLQDIKINYMIHMGTPVREKDINQEDFSPANFNKLLNFYSTGDLVVPLGSLSKLKNLINRNAKSIRKFSTHNFNVKNIRVQNNGLELGHSNFVSELLDNLYEVIRQIECDFCFEVDLDLNVTSRKSEFPVLLTVRNSILTNVFDEQLKLVMQMSNKNIKSKIMIQNILKQTYQKSFKNEKIFKAIYKTDIHQKNKVSSFLTNFYNKLAVLLKT